MLRVSSISLGLVRFAIVNGGRVGEGDSLELKTDSGPVTVHVAGIEDGIVHFKSCGQRIDVKLCRGAEQNPH